MLPEHHRLARAGRLLTLAAGLLVCTVSVGAAAIDTGIASSLPSISIDLPTILDLAPAKGSHARAAEPALADDASAPDALKHLASQSRCLAEVIYYEARGESEEGQRAVAEVILHRLAGGEHGRTVCDVVYEGANQTFCQLTFVCDGSLDRTRSPDAWRQAQVLAAQMLSGEISSTAETGDATYYHTVDVHPTWAPRMTRVTQIGHHIFYSEAPKPVLLTAAFRGSLQ